MSMQVNAEDAPRWASAPGDTIKRVLDSRGLTTEDLADALGFSDPQARRLVNGEFPVTVEVAQRLAEFLGSSAQFWQRREAIYRDSLSWLHADELVRRSPVTEMVSRGWIDGTAAGWRYQAEALMGYFGVGDAGEWSAVWTRRLSAAHYRTSESFESDELSVAAWLRRAELEASQQHIGTFSPKQLRRTIPDLRLLTKVGDPRRFVPVARRYLAEAGVALVLIQGTKESRLSGAAFKLSSDARAVALSARHLAEDHLWFTLFHEIGHLLLHDADGEFLDVLDETRDETAVEQEANSFARESLLPGGVAALKTGQNLRPNMRQIMRFAGESGVAPGIVVGRLHYDGILDHSQQNRLIRRYRWSDGILTQKI